MSGVAFTSDFDPKGTDGVFRNHGNSVLASFGISNKYLFAFQGHVSLLEPEVSAMYLQFFVTHPLRYYVLRTSKNLAGLPPPQDY
jgi:hypothetical protein